MKSIGVVVITSLISSTALADDPISGIEPHVLFKNGCEVTAEVESEKAGDDKEQAPALEVTCRLTADWALGVDLPCAFKEEASESSHGRGDGGVYQIPVSGKKIR